MGAVNCLAVDCLDQVAGLQAGFGRRGLHSNLLDGYLVQDRVAQAVEKHYTQDYPDEQVHSRPGHQDSQAHPGTGSRQSTLYGWVVFPLWAHKTSQGDPVHGEFSAAGFEKLEHAGWKADPEFFYFDLQQARNNEMPELV